MPRRGRTFHWRWTAPASRCCWCGCRRWWGTWRTSCWGRSFCSWPRAGMTGAGLEVESEDHWAVASQPWQETCPPGGKVVKNLFSLVTDAPSKRARSFIPDKLFCAGLMFARMVRRLTIKWNNVKCSTWVGSCMTQVLWRMLQKYRCNLPQYLHILGLKILN